MPDSCRRATVVLEDNEEDRARMRGARRAHRERAASRAASPDDATRGGFGSPQTMVAEARKHLGYPRDGRRTTRSSTAGSAPIGGYPHGGFGYPWCHAFVSYCLCALRQRRRRAADGRLPRRRGWFQQRGRFLSEPQGWRHRLLRPRRRHARRARRRRRAKHDPDDRRQHVGVGRRPTFFNGDGVYEKTVQRTSRIFGYGRPEYSSGAGRCPAAAAQAAAAGTTASSR